MKIRTSLALTGAVFVLVQVLSFLSGARRDEAPSFHDQHAAALKAQFLEKKPKTPIKATSTAASTTQLEDTTASQIEGTSPLYDQTLFYNTSVDRLWLDDDAKQKPPPAMLLLTTYAWNQPNQTDGRLIFRGARSRELYEGIINHPWFHPTAWQDLNEGRMELSNATRYYVFLDRETAGEKNWPWYGRGVVENADRHAGRDTCCGFQTLMVDEVMSSRVMSAKNAKYILMDGAGWGPRQRFLEARAQHDKIVFLSLSARHDQLIPGRDLGLPPPAVRPCRLTASMKKEMLSDCRLEDGRRPVLLSLLAAMRFQARKDLKKLHNGKDIRVAHTTKAGILVGLEPNNITNITDPYHLLATSSQFGAAPRGDNLFSYRFPEVASCGAIPVIYADDWQLPFVSDVVEWADAAVIIPERYAINSREILEAIPHERKCQMRQKALEYYETYLESGLKTMTWIVNGLESLAMRNVDSYTGNYDSVQSSPQQTCSPKSPLVDHTLCYRDDIQREWLEPNQEVLPPVMLMLTSAGWNNPKPGKKFPRYTWYRGLRTRELVEGVINHKWFHPGGSSMFMNRTMEFHSNVTYVFFLDFETCAEPSYPHYKNGTRSNADTIGGRWDEYKDFSQKILKAVWRQIGDAQNVSWKLVYFDCSRKGSFALRENNLDPHFVVASVSAMRYHAVEEVDQGLVFPAYRRYEMTPEQHTAVATCREEARPILLSFSGHLHSRPRSLLRKLHNGKNVMIGTPQELRPTMNNATDFYFELAAQSSFAAVPRGWHVGTSRLTEVMSAGAIPVIIADYWVLPMAHAINWTDIAVVIAEEDTSSVLQIIMQISLEERCRMRQRMMQVYHKYMSTGDGVIDGLVQGLYQRVRPAG